MIGKKGFHFIAALVISVLLHLALFGMIKVIISEPYIGLNAERETSFLGSILKQELISPSKLALSKKEQFEETPSYLRLKPYHVELAVVKIRRRYPDNSFSAAPKLVLTGTRQQPEPKYIKGKPTFVKIQARRKPKDTTNIAWKAASNQRDIVYKPPLPEYRFWTDEIKDEFNLEFEFLVHPEGNIGLVKRLTSSGYSEVDAMAMRYLKGWQFTPSHQKQWGRVRINFKLQ